MRESSPGVGPQAAGLAAAGERLGWLAAAAADAVEGPHLLPLQLPG